MGKDGLALSIAQRKLMLPNGVQLAYYDSHPDGGAEDGVTQTIVLLHGYCGSSAYWEEVAVLLEERVRVIAPDLRGHGQSSAPDDEMYAMEQFAEDIGQLLIGLQVHNAIVLGHSLGGYITLAFAEKYAKKLSAFGLVHSTPLPDAEAARQNRDKAVAALQDNGVAVFVDGLVPKLFAPAHLETLADVVEHVKQIGNGTSLHGAQATARGMKARPDRRAIIEQAGLPVLLIACANDGVIPVESVFAAGNEAADKVTLAQAGHMGMLEETGELAAAILRFARKLEE
jgi:3-oxoadipate enol-lactonase